MAKRAAPYRIYDRDGVAWIDVRSIPGFPRIRETLDAAYRDERTGREPSRAAEEAAAQRYTDLVRGRTVVATDRVLTALTDEELIAMWLTAIETPRNKKSVDTKTIYGRTWHAFFADADHWPDARTPLMRMVDDVCLYDYAAHRLTCVLRKTVGKELTAMFEFFAWAKVHRHIAVVPARPVLPKGSKGVRAGKQRHRPVDIEPEQAMSIVAALPVWSRAAARAKTHPHQKPFRVRAPIELTWEMTWRPSFVARLSVPGNWSPGRTTATIFDEQDKSGYGREVSLTPRAVAILEECASDRGLIFGEHDYRKYVKAAAAKVLSPALAKQFARYDFRHGRINQMLDVTGDMLGTAYNAGHKQLTTTNEYLRAKRRQGDAVIDALSTGTSRARAPQSDRNPQQSQSGRRDSNPRPLDPQRASVAEALGIFIDDAPGGHVNYRQDPDDPVGLGARYGHNELTDASRTLAIYEVLCDAYASVDAALRDEDES